VKINLTKVHKLSVNYLNQHEHSSSGGRKTHESRKLVKVAAHLCPSSCATVKASASPVSSLMLQLRCGWHRPDTWDRPSVLHGSFIREQMLYLQHHHHTSIPHLTFDHNLGKCRSILKILSLTNSWRNCQNSRTCINTNASLCLEDHQGVKRRWNRETNRQTDGQTPDCCFMLIATDATSVIMQQLSKHGLATNFVKFTEQLTRRCQCQHVYHVTILQSTYLAK